MYVCLFPFSCVYGSGFIYSGFEFIYEVSFLFSKYIVSLPTVVKGKPKGLFSIITTARSR